MKKFLFLIREDIRLLENLTPEQGQRDIQKMVSWVEEITQSGNYIQGDPLEKGLAMVSKDDIVMDGPFIEAKEAISGYTIIKAESLVLMDKISA